jgi:hypothetical protein
MLVISLHPLNFRGFFSPLTLSRVVNNIDCLALERKNGGNWRRRKKRNEKTIQLPLAILAHLSSSFSLSSLSTKNSSERDGRISRVLDDLTRSSALELDGNNAATTSITCPPRRGAELGVTLSHLVFLMRAHAPGKGCSLEVEVRDDRGVRRRIRASTFQPVSKVAPGIASLPLRLEEEGGEGRQGKKYSSSTSTSRKWHRVPLDLDALVRRAWGTRYRETLLVTVHACCRLRRVYFADKGYEGESALPPEYRLYAPASAIAAVAAAAAAAALVPEVVPVAASPLPAAAAAASVDEEQEAGKDIASGVREAEVATAEVVVGEEKEEEEGKGGTTEASEVVPVA